MMQPIGIVEILGIVLIILYIVWLVAFFQFVRPRLMDRAAERMNVRVHESADPLDAGTYNVKGETSLAKSAAVQLLDAAVLLVGTVGVCAVISIPAFLVGETGLPYRWESVVLGTQVTLVSVQIEPVRGGTANVAAAISNDGSANASQCQVRTFDYTANNGYMNGSSPLFDLSPHESRTVVFPLSVQKPARGDYAVPFSLECQNRLKDKITTRVQVVE